MTTVVQLVPTSGRDDERCVAPGHCVLRVDDLRKSFSKGLPPWRRRVEVLRGASLMVCSGELVDQAVADLLAELSFGRYRRYRVEELSGGTRQKLNLALALMHEPKLLLLDEPYSGFDWETYLRFWEMAERRRADGMGILIVSHFLSERDRLDRVYELKGGKAVAR